MQHKWNNTNKKHYFNLEIFIEAEGGGGEGGSPYLDWDFSKIQNVISPLIFEIWRNEIQLLTALAVVFLKKCERLEFKNF